MKRAMIAALCLTLVLSLTGCSSAPKPGSGERSEPVTEYTLTATVLTGADGAMTVGVKECLPSCLPIEGMKSEALNVPITNMPASPEPLPGDTVEITFNGRITTTVPEGGAENYSISSADLTRITVVR